MALSTDSLAQQSPLSSPSPSQSAQQEPVTIETLISYLVQAKRSLASIHHVHRATTVLAEARANIESTAALIARTSYLRRSLQTQAKVLRGIQFSLEGAANSIQVEFQASIKELDSAGKRLEQTTERLKQTAIEDGFKASLTSVDADDDNDHHDGTTTLIPQKNNLYDFVEDKPIESLREAMREVIDHVQDNQEDVNRSLRNLEDDLQYINELLTTPSQNQNPFLSATGSSGNSNDYQPPHLPSLLKHLESSAHSMAESLESLVKHFDLCVTAIKHTEGAGDAVVRKYNAGNLPTEVIIEQAEVANLVEGPSLEPMMSAQEREEMLAVLSNDAAEVEEVVMEIHEHAAEMEGNLNEILHWRERHEKTHGDVIAAFRHLETIGTRLSGFVAASAAQTSRWVEDRARIEDGVAGMEELCETYENFCHAYDRLIVEAARRRSVKKQMERVVEEAQGRLDELFEGDLKERQLFREELGDYLPSDIWEGLHLGPARYKVDRIDSVREGREEWLSVPELERGVVEGALRRLKGKAS